MQFQDFYKETTKCFTKVFPCLLPLNVHIKVDPGGSFVIKLVVVVPSLSQCNKVHTCRTGPNHIQSCCSGATHTKLHHDVVETPYYWAVRMLSDGLRKKYVFKIVLYNDVL